ncbi:hypothetical protein CC80DRAFT_509781 [Byssothecium circinans]|uniref:F-box domain-containing protein n=1 Tax=Byssothecium circinans TaxID=147558 RepID=A0A6A5TEB8_9PLEO|nr:hypothetical protein CC80DRAFT_509781 [Byssothecium circinans]
MESSAKATPYLPPELWNQIFSHLTILRDGKANNDAQTLCSMCLVSHRFREVAQPHLYATIKLDIASHQAKRLRQTLRAKPHLGLAVKEVVIECSSDYYGLELRHFLQELLQSMRHLRLFHSNHRGCTIKLIESVLYKEGSSYKVDVPTDLANLRSLELLAHDLVFKYNYVLRLPQLERLCLNFVDLSDHNEDTSLPDDWGWISPTVKELVLRLALPAMFALCLRRRSLSALSRSLPCLEALTIEHSNELVTPILIRRTMAAFSPQLETSLRRLETASIFPYHSNGSASVMSTNGM